MATETGKETEMATEMARRKNRIRHKKAYMSGEKIELEIKKHPVKIEKVPHILKPGDLSFCFELNGRKRENIGIQMKTHPRTESEGWV